MDSRLEETELQTEQKFNITQNVLIDKNKAKGESQITDTDKKVKLSIFLYNEIAYMYNHIYASYIGQTILICYYYLFLNTYIL